MREYILKRWYPSLPTEWIWSEFPIIVVEREDGYHLHPSLKGKTRFAIIPEREVERNEDFWIQIGGKTKKIDMNNKDLLKEIKKLIREEYKNHKLKYHDKEEPMIGLLDGKLVFYDGNLFTTRTLE